MKDLKLVITGGIASGKTAVTEYLGSLGAEVVDADIIAHKILCKEGRCYKAVFDEFGAEYFDESGNLDRRKLGELIHSSRSAKESLENILHPVIFEELQEFLDKHSGLVIAAIPLYFDTPRRLKGVLEVWTVEAEIEIRVARMTKRDNRSINYAYKVINNQLPSKRRIALADRVIMNNGSIEELCSAINAALSAVR